MNDNKTPPPERYEVCAATPREELLRILLDSRIPKNELEHFAARLISELERENAELLAALGKALSWAECYRAAAECTGVRKDGPLFTDLRECRAAIAKAKGTA